jgi:hypothetical protein
MRIFSAERRASKSSWTMSIYLGAFAQTLLLGLPMMAQQGPNPAGADMASIGDSRSQGPNVTGPNGSGPADDRLGPVEASGGCGDILSAALQQDGDASPCWADVRTVDHWNTMRLADGATVRSGPGFLPTTQESPTSFTFAVGGVGGLLYQGNADASAYSGVGAFTGHIERPKWELMYEDGGGLGNLMSAGSNLVGVNRAAIRANANVTPRWLLQGSATNAFGNDGFRLFAPLDYRTVGETEAPVTDTVAYGLHSGNLVDEQEDAQLSTAGSRRTKWNFAAAHTLRYYSDDGVNVQTVRGRGEYLFSTSQNTALGFLAGGAHQDGPSPCSLGGAGLLGLMKWGSRASLSVSGNANGASSSCGKSVQFTGDAALYIRASLHDDLYLTGNRDLSDGIVENLALLDSAGGGWRHQFTRNTSLHLNAAAIYGTDPKTHLGYNGEFEEAAATYPLGAGFLQETSYRHFQVSKIPGGDNRNVVTFTLWWSPRKNGQTLLSRR